MLMAMMRKVSMMQHATTTVYMVQRGRLYYKLRSIYVFMQTLICNLSLCVYIVRLLQGATSSVATIVCCCCNHSLLLCLFHFSCGSSHCNIVVLPNCSCKRLNLRTATTTHTHCHTCNVYNVAYAGSSFIRLHCVSK